MNEMTAAGKRIFARFNASRNLEEGPPCAPKVPFASSPCLKPSPRPNRVIRCVLPNSFSFPRQLAGGVNVRSRLGFERVRTTVLE
jgi:hypothetical protein